MPWGRAARGRAADLVRDGVRVHLR